MDNQEAFDIVVAHARKQRCKSEGLTGSCQYRGPSGRMCFVGATMAADWMIRVHTPAWLRLAGLTTQADALAGMPEITDFAKCPSLMPTLNAVRTDANAAWAAAGDAARAAAGDAAWAAAWAAARAAAGDAARAAAGDAAWAAAGDAARAAAGDAARAAAGDAAWAAAGDAARDALKPTTEALQISAQDLLRRMIEVS